MDAYSNQMFPCRSPVRTASPQPICCLAVDAEEDFDWDQPGYPTGYTTASMTRIAELHSITSAYRLKPIYLLTYPVLQDAEVLQVLRAQWENGACDLGIQLHPWVTPPLDEAGRSATYLGQLDPAMAEAKLLVLMGRFREVFGTTPRVFRAGRYGISAAVSRLLEDHGFGIDTSLAPRTDMVDGGGPDFSGFGSEPFWFGRRHRVLEVPLCRDLIGWGGRFAPLLYRAGRHGGPLGRTVAAGLSRLRCTERVTLSPEGNDAAAMRRLLRARVRQGQTVFTLSFHSSSLAPGRNPYVQSQADLHVFYDRLSEALDTMARMEFRFAGLPELPAELGDTA